MNRIKYFVIVICTLLSGIVSAQEWAGPDTSVCQGAGALLGVSSAPNDYCYNWTPAEGLSSTTAKRPTANPSKTTEYTLVAIGPDFSNKVVDKVKVTVELGGVVTAPSYTEPDGTTNQAHAHLTVKEPGTSIEWSIEGENHGCVINPTTGNISYCNSAGEVTIRATDATNEECYAEGTFRVNVGVKQVYAIDETHPTRKATNGDTLYLIGHNDVKLKAIPNDGESFTEDQPDWTASTVQPPSPNAAEWSHSEGSPSFMHIEAGGKSVNVARIQPTEVTLTNIVHTLNTLLKMLEQFCSPSSDLAVGYDPDKSVCEPLHMGFTHNLTYKQIPVEKFNSPKKGLKEQLEGEINGSLTAKVCFPPPYSSAPNPLFMWSTYVFGSGTTKLNAGVSKDESLASPASWQVDELNFSGTLKFGVGGEVGVYVPGDFFGIQGTLLGDITISIDPTFSSPLINSTVKIEPLVIEGSLKVFWLNPDNTVINLTGKYNLLDPLESQPFKTLDLTQFQ